MIIGLAGKKQVGKNTVSSMIQHLLTINTKDNNKTVEWIEKSFAYKVKVIASILTGIPVKEFEYSKFKESNLPEEWSKTTNSLGHKVPMKVRVLLQKIGTEAIREQIHPNAWVNALFADYTPIDYETDVDTDRVFNATFDRPIYPSWLVTDVRFPNEVDAIKERNGLLIKVTRSTEEKDNHPSETALDDYKDWDAVIENNGSKQDLLNSVEKNLKDLKLL